MRTPSGRRCPTIGRSPRTQGISPALLGRWHRQALEQAVPSSAGRAEINQLRAELRRVEMERDILKKAVTIFSQTPQS